MDKLFLTILNMSLSGAFVIAAICIARQPLKKAPKIISYCLWSISGFRLMFPFSVESMFSLIPFKAQTIPVDIAVQAVPRIDSGIPFVNNAVSSVFPSAATAAAGANPVQIWTTIGSWAWLAGAVVMLVYGVVSYVRLKHKMRSAIRVEGNLYETDGINSPFVLGVIKPKIYIPLYLSNQEREYVILHEQTHIKRRDYIVKFAAYFVLCLHWFNPLVWLAFMLLSVDLEMSCDERVIKEMGGDTKKDYSRSLLTLASNRRLIAGSPLAFSEGGLKERIKRVLNFKKPSRVIIVLAAVLAIILSAGFVANRASEETNGGENGPYMFKDVARIVEVESLRSVIVEIVDPDALQDRYNNKNIFSPGDILRAEIHFDATLLETAQAGDIVLVSRGNSITVDTSREPHTFPCNAIDAYTATVTIQVWKDEHGSTRFTLFDGDVTDALSELANGRVMNDIAELNAALAEYYKGYMTVRVKHSFDFTKEEMRAIVDSFVIPAKEYALSIGAEIPSDPAGGLDADTLYMTGEETHSSEPTSELDTNMLSKLYLGMTNEKVYALFGEPDFSASGLMWYGYTDVGVFDPMSLDSNGLIKRISLKDSKYWSIGELIDTTVMQRKTPDTLIEEAPFLWYEIVSIDANERGFTAKIISQYELYIPDGEYSVRRTDWEYSYIDLSFAKNSDFDYVLTSYYCDDGVWPMGMAPVLRCYENAMYHFVGAVPRMGTRFGIGYNSIATAVVNNYAQDVTGDRNGFLIKYFPGATFQIEPFDEENALMGYEPGSWIIKYADMSKNINVGRDGTGEIPITDDMLGIYDTSIDDYAIRFDKYVKGE